MVHVIILAVIIIQYLFYYVNLCQIEADSMYVKIVDEKKKEWQKTHPINKLKRSSGGKSW